MADDDGEESVEPFLVSMEWSDGGLRIRRVDYRDFDLLLRENGLSHASFPDQN